MKVLFVFGGMPHYLAKLLNKIQNMGIDVHVLLPTKAGKTIGKGVVQIDDGLNFPISNSAERIAWWGKPYYKDLSNIINELKPNILVVGWPYFMQIFFQPSLRRSLSVNKTKLIIREIPFQVPPFSGAYKYFKANSIIDESNNVLSVGLGFMFRTEIIRHIRKYCYKKAAATLNYSSTALSLLPTYGVALNKIFVTGNCNDTEVLFQERAIVELQPRILSENSNRIIHIGRLVKWKRVDLLIDAFVFVLKEIPSAELLIVGDGPEMQNLKEQCNLLGISGHVIFVGAQHNSKILGKYMHESNVYVLAGMGGLSINDAMTYRLPIVCSVCDGTEIDLVKDGVNGFFFKSNDAKDLASKVTIVLKNRNLQQSMGEESESIIRTQMNIESVSERFIEAFNFVIK